MCMTKVMKKKNRNKRKRGKTIKLFKTTVTSPNMEHEMLENITHILAFNTDSPHS